MHSSLESSVRCLKTKVANHNGLFTNANDDLVRNYLAYADLVVENVQQGKISEAQARAKLAQAYSELNGTALSRAYDARQAFLRELAFAFEEEARSSERQQRQQAHSTTCYRIGNTIHCSHY